MQVGAELGCRFFQGLLVRRFRNCVSLMSLQTRLAVELRRNLLQFAQIAAEEAHSDAFATLAGFFHPDHSSGAGDVDVAS